MGFFDFFPYTNFHNVNLDWVLQRVKEWGELVEANNTAFHNLEEANASFKEYVTNYLANLDVQAEIDDKLDRMLESGVLTEYIQPYISEGVSTWLDENITEPSGVIIDKSLTVDGACADSKAVGDAINNEDEKINALTERVDNINDGLTDNAKNALLACFENIALWLNGDGDELIRNLERELYYVPPIIEYPNLERGNVLTNYLFDGQGNIVANSRQFCNTEFFDIEDDTDYYWVQGFNERVSGESPDFAGGCNAYRVCYYDRNKNFISRWINDYTTVFDYIEPRYEKLVIPNNAKYFRVSWGLLPCGNIYKSIPRNLYAVIIVLANLDDSIITGDENLPSRFTVTRNGVNITNQIKTGNNTISVDDRIDGIAWVRNIFNVLTGGSPETGSQHPDTETRIYNAKTFLLQTGDAIHFDNVKSAVRAERIYDGYVQHSLEWNTTNETFIIGG